MLQLQKKPHLHILIRYSNSTLEGWYVGPLELCNVSILKTSKEEFTNMQIIIFRHASGCSNDSNEESSV